MDIEGRESERGGHTVDVTQGWGWCVGSGGGGGG